MNCNSVLKKLRVLAALCLIASLLAACNRDPNVAKQRYLQNGNKYYDKGKYKEALIMYQNALKRDLKFGEAYYRSALAELKLGRFAPAARDLQRAVELQPTNADAIDRLTNLYLTVYLADRKRPRQLLDELNGLADKYSKRFPNGYSEARLRGYLALFASDKAGALQSFAKAYQLKPFQQDLLVVYMQTLTASDRFPEAEKLGREMIAKNPEALSVYDILYVQYNRLNKRAEAEDILKLKAEKNPNNPDGRLQLAAHYFATGNRQAMTETLNALKAAGQTFPNAPLLVGDFYARIREYDLAAKEFREGAQRSAKDKHMYEKRLVEVLVRQDHKQEAVQLVDNILKEDSKDMDAIALRASLILLGGDRSKLDSAIADLKTVIGKSPSNPVLHYNLGRALYAKQDFDGARAQFEEAVKLRPDFLLPRITIAQMTLQRRDYNKVVQMAQEILTYDPNNVSARLLRSRALTGTGDRKQAREELEKLSAQMPNLAEAQLQLAGLDLQDQKFREAEGTFRKLYGQSKDPRAFIGLVDVLAASGKTDEALKLLRDELTANPKRIDYRMAVAAITSRAGDYKTAIAEYQKVIEAAPKSPQVWVAMSDVYRRAGQLDQAVSSARKAQELAPDKVAAHLQLALLYDTAGRKPEAQPVYEQILRLEPDNVVALNNLAYILAESGNNLDQALTMAQKARQKSPSSEDIADTLGWIYIKKNLPDSAVSVFRELVEKNPGKSTFRYHLAMALFQKGEKAQAKRECEAALRGKPDSTEAARIRDLMARLG